MTRRASSCSVTFIVPSSAVKAPVEPTGEPAEGPGAEDAEVSKRGQSVVGLTSDALDRSDWHGAASYERAEAVAIASGQSLANAGNTVSLSVQLTLHGGGP